MRSVTGAKPLQVQFPIIATTESELGLQCEVHS